MNPSIAAPLGPFFVFNLIWDIVPESVGTQSKIGPSYKGKWLHPN